MIYMVNVAVVALIGGGKDIRKRHIMQKNIVRKIKLLSQNKSAPLEIDMRVPLLQLCSQVVFYTVISSAPYSNSP